MEETTTLETLARRAVDGDRDAVADLVRRLEPPVYAVALRMLWHREDAEDATQEILVRVITRLSQYDFQSKLKTWVFRVATNYLLDVKKSCVEGRGLTFASFGDDLAEGVSTSGPADEEHSVLTEEVKIGCTLGMLQCLDRPHRLAYVLGEIMDLSAREAAAALGLDPATFRKRLQRAREAVETFTRAHCGIVSEAASCQCNRRVPVALRLGRVRPDAPMFARDGTSFTDARAFIRRIEETQRVLELQRKALPPRSSSNVAELVIAAIDTAGSPHALDDALAPRAGRPS
jgi:RNA polymerase sigma factor (sigma-70 family)